MRALLLSLLCLAAAKPRGRQEPEILNRKPMPKQDPVIVNRQIQPKRPLDDYFEYRNPDFTADGQPLFESDMLLTEEQRSNRQAVSNLWTSPVHFAISSSSAADRDAIIAGIQQWRDNTCIEFNEVAENSPTYHINVIKSSGCWSYVGKISSSGKQDLSIGSGCTRIGTVVHEFGHALGLLHQQSRPDRDTYVEILLENVISGREGNFRISSNSQNYSVPYDFTSVMHYGTHYFSVNSLPTIRVRDSRYEGLIGQRAGLSHRDKQIANLMYNCAAGCSNPPTCQNGGYVDKNCVCACPPNADGENCENLNGGYYPGVATDPPTTPDATTPEATTPDATTPEATTPDATTTQATTSAPGGNCVPPGGPARRR